LRFLEERDQVRDLRLEALRRDIQKGINSGEPTPWTLMQSTREGANGLRDKIARRHEISGFFDPPKAHNKSGYAVYF